MPEVCMSRLVVGDVAPNFTLQNHAGTPISLSDVLKEHNALLLFNLGFI